MAFLVELISRKSSGNWKPPGQPNVIDTKRINDENY
jgi:hypothetical protein